MRLKIAQIALALLLLTSFALAQTTVSGIGTPVNGNSVSLPAGWTAAGSGSSQQVTAPGTLAVGTTVQLGAGVDATGATDVTTALQTAINNAAAAGQTLVAGGTYKITGKVVIKGNADFSNATFLVYGSPAIAVEVSTGNSSDPTTSLRNATIKLPKLIQNMEKIGTVGSAPSVLGWSGFGVGVRVVNAYSCRIWTGEIYGFTTGLLVTSFGTGNVYNEYYIGHLHDNQVNLELNPGNSNAWTNENNFYGGRFSFESSEGSSVAETRQILIAKSATHAVNNNVFYKPSLEGDVPEYHLENGGAANVLLSARWEALTPKVLYSAANANQASDNVILYGYNSRSIVFTMSGSSAFRNTYIPTAAVGGYYTQGADNKMRITSSSANPAISLYEADTVLETAAQNDWASNWGAQTLNGKRKADLYARVKLDFVSGRLYFGNASADPSCYYSAYGVTALATNCKIQPLADASFDLGVPSYRFRDAYFSGKGEFDTGIQPSSASAAITGFLKTTHASLDFASVATGACSAVQTETITGANLGDSCSVSTGTALEDGGFFRCAITDTNTVKWQLCNLSGGAIDRASDSYTIRVLR